MIICSCRNISSECGLTGRQLKELLEDPETIKCGKCIEELRTAKHFRVEDMTKLVDGAMIKRDYDYEHFKQRLELNQLIGNVYDKKKVTVKLFNERGGTGLSRLSAVHCCGISVYYGDSHLNDYKFVDIEEKCPKLYEYWLKKLLVKSNYKKEDETEEKAE
jgi:hypothetical protein